MYKKAYGIIETLAPLHVGATAGEESGNLNLIFRDQFTQTGIIPGSSIRGRLRTDMREKRISWLEEQWKNQQPTSSQDDDSKLVYSLEKEHSSNPKKFPSYLSWLEKEVNQASDCPDHFNEQRWYGHEAVDGESNSTTESLVKFEYASLLWLPVFCPGQPVVWVSCPKLLKRYQRIVGEKLKDTKVPGKYTGSSTLKPLNVEGTKKLFFNFGFLELKGTENLKAWFPNGEELPAVVVGDDEIGMIHDMALYRQSRVRLKDDEKRVDGGGFFNTEALPEGTIMVFPIAVRDTGSEGPWKPFGTGTQSGEIYLGGLESIGFGNCQITLKGEGVTA